MHEGSAQFSTTRWTVILAAKSSPHAWGEALTQLTGSYWRPLYVFFLRKGLSESAAQDDAVSADDASERAWAQTRRGRPLKREPWVWVGRAWRWCRPSVSSFERSEVTVRRCRGRGRVTTPSPGPEAPRARLASQ